VETYSLDRPLPDGLAVRSALDAYLGENAFTTAEYDARTVTVTFWGVSFTLPNPPSRRLAVRFHDLHHVITGYGTDPAGEFEVSAWELRHGIGVFGVYVRLIILGGALAGMLIYPRRTLAAWKAAKAAPRFSKPTLEFYEVLMNLSVGELREHFGVPHGGVAGRRTLHENAPDSVAVASP